MATPGRAPAGNHGPPGRHHGAGRNPHFGAVVSFEEYDQLAARLAASGVTFVVTPRIRYAGEPGEQGTFFFLDPSGNALEFKAFRRPGEVFAR